MPPLGPVYVAKDATTKVGPILVVITIIVAVGICVRGIGWMFKLAAVPETTTTLLPVLADDHCVPFVDAGLRMRVSFRSDYEAKF